MKWIMPIIFLFSFLTLSAQKATPILTTTILQTPDNFQFKSLLEHKIDYTLPFPSFAYRKPSTYLFRNVPNHLPGIFCKMEYKIQSKSKLAPRFRLGSFNYTEWMEGKGEYYSRYWK